MGLVLSVKTNPSILLSRFVCLTRIDNNNIMSDDDGRKSLGECLVILQVDLKKLEQDCMNIEEV